MKNKGFGIIEALIGITIGGLLLVTFSTLIYQTIKINRVNASQIKATMYLQEMIEVTKDLEQSDWNQIADKNCVSSAATICYPDYGTLNNWVLKEDTTKQPIENGIYKRWLTIDKVYRDSNGQIVGAGTESTSTKKIIGYVEWYTYSNFFGNSTPTLTTSKIEIYVYKY